MRKIILLVLFFMAGHLCPAQNKSNDSYIFFFVNIKKSEQSCSVVIDSTRCSVKLTLPKDCQSGDDSIGLDALKMFVVKIQDGKKIVVPVNMEGAYDFSQTNSANITAFAKKILGPDVIGNDFSEKVRA